MARKQALSAAQAIAAVRSHTEWSGEGADRRAQGSLFAKGFLVRWSGSKVELVELFRQRQAAAQALEPESDEFEGEVVRRFNRHVTGDGLAAGCHHPVGLF